MSEHCVIIGASHAAAQLALSARRLGWSGSITVIGDEEHLPYHRPPLSKTLLSGEKDAADIAIRPQASYDKADVAFQLGTRVEAIDRDNGQLRLQTGGTIAYDKLALTVGARPRQIPLPGSDKDGVFYLRTLGDAQRIRGYVGHGKRAVIIGGGYIGLETAASLNKAGMQVTVLEALPRVLARVTTSDISGFYQRIHGEEGVDIVTDVDVEEIAGKESAEAVRCSDGRTYAADLVIIGVGVVPNTELAESAGLAIDNGIVVDAYARTSDPNIVAAGDCTCHHNPIYRRSIRLESVQNANEQASIAAASICGELKEYRALPWFWSDQFDLKLQIAGLSQGYEDVVIRGDISRGRSFSAFYLAGGRLLAVDAVNKPQDFMLSKRIISENLDIDVTGLANESLALKDLIRS